ncbi:PEP-utilizing enzyme, partial [Aerococcus sp. L_32]
IALTFSESQARKLVLAWGVEPFVVEKPASTDEMMSLAGTVAKESGYAQDGDTIIISAGVPVGEKGTTNLMKIQVIGEKLVSGSGIGEKSVVGHAVVVDNAADAVANVKANSVLVVKSTDNDYNEAIKNAAAVVVEKGGLTSHAAVLGVENGIPVVVGAENATSSIENGQLVTVDARRGIVYNGATTTI